MESSSNCLYRVKVDLSICRQNRNIILQYFSKTKYRKNISFRRCKTCSRKVKLKFGNKRLKAHLRQHKNEFDNYLESLAMTMQNKGGPDLIDSSDEEDDSENEEEESDEDFNPYNAVDCLQASTFMMDRPKLTVYEKNLKRQFTYDDQTDPRYQEFSDYDVFQMCNLQLKDEISKHLGKALPCTRMNPRPLYDITRSKVVHMIDRLVCPRNCYYDPEKCFFDDQHTYDYKELLRKDLHERFNPEFAKLFVKDDKEIKLKRMESNHPDTTKLIEDIGFTTKLVYDSKGYLVVNFDAIQKKFWDYETPQFVLEQKKVLDTLLGLLISSQEIRNKAKSLISSKYEQREIDLNPPLLATMHHGPDIELRGIKDTKSCNLKHDEWRYEMSEDVIHPNCKFLARSAHWTYVHNGENLSTCVANDGKALEGPVSMPDQSIAYPCNLKCCWKGCLCRFCKLAISFECKDHKAHMQHNLRQCILQKSAQCQEHWLDHPDNFEVGDIDVKKNILFHNGHLLENGRQYCTKKVKCAGLKLICVQCREDVREHFSKHLTPHSQCKICVHELLSIEDETFWEKVCQVCGKEFSSQKARDHHRKKHDQEKLECNLCVEVFTSNFTLHRHLQEQHNHSTKEDGEAQFENKVNIFACGRCKQEFKYKRNLMTHIESVHERTEPCTCKICDQKIAKSSHLKRHMREKHSALNVKKVLKKEEITDFKCEQCLKVFKRREHLLQHLSVHQVLGPQYNCEECDASFSNTRNLDRHKRIHLNSLPSHKCDLCGEQFSQKFNLERHLKLHEEPDMKYACNLCGSSFSREDNLKNHLKKFHNVS